MIGAIVSGKRGLLNTVFAGFRLREEVIPLHCLYRLNTSFILVLVDLLFSLPYELLTLGLLVEIWRACCSFLEKVLSSGRAGFLVVGEVGNFMCHCLGLKARLILMCFGSYWL